MNGVHGRGVAALLLVLGLGACGGDEPAEVLSIPDEPGCNPLDPSFCSYPFPSMFFMRADADSPTGYRLNFTADNAGVDGAGGQEPFVEYMNRADGYSISTPLLAHIGDEPVDRDSLPAWENVAASVEPTSPIQILDRTSGERVPLWAETDDHAAAMLEGSSAAEVTARTSLMIRLQEGLQPNRRYAVVITDGVLGESGSPIVADDAFRALRDEIATDNTTLEEMRPEYEELFTFLADHGVERERTVLAWEFHSFSDEFITGTLVPHVEIARDAVEANTFEDTFDYEILACATSEEEDAAVSGCTYDAELHETEWRRIRGRFRVPAFQGIPGQTREIQLDAEGNPMLDGTLQAELTVMVPNSLRDAAAGSAPILVFGHGLLAQASDYIHNPDDNNGAMQIANDLGAIAVATRWVGLSTGDTLVAATAISDLSTFQSFVEGLVQSMVSTTLLVPFTRSTLASDPVLATSDGSASLVDPEYAVYYGISQGGIFGTVFMAVSPDVKSGVLHVPTSMYANVLQHSALFGDFQAILDLTYQDPFEQQMYLAWGQRLFDPLEPMNYVRHLADEPLTDLGAKNFLWQINYGDNEAPDFNAYPLARTIDAPLVDMSSPNEFYGLSTIATPTAPNTSGMMVFDPGLGRDPLVNANGSPQTFAHGSTRRNPEVIEQAVTYLAEDTAGTITTNCGGPCSVTPVPRAGRDTYP